MTNTGSGARTPDENETRGQVPRAWSDREHEKRARDRRGLAQSGRAGGNESPVGEVGRAPPGVVRNRAE